MKFLKKEQYGKVHLVILAFLVIFAMITVQTYAGKSKGKGYLGVNIEKLSGDDREEFGVRFGVLVTGVTKDEAAFKAGLKKYDVIQYIDDIKTRRPDDVAEAVSRSAPGTKVKIKYVRDGKGMSATVVLGKWEMNELYLDQAGNKLRFFGDKLHGELKKLKELEKLNGLKNFKMKKGAYLGVEMRIMDENFAKYFGVKKDGGALIMNVTKGSAAEKAGILSGDVILKIEGKMIKGPGDVSKAIMGKKKGDKIILNILRHKKVKKITVELGERSFGGAMFFGDKGNNIFRFDFQNAPINVPEIMEDVKVWRDSDGNLLKLKLKLIKEKEKMKQIMMKKEIEMKKMNKLMKKELKEKLKRIEEKEEEVFI